MEISRIKERLSHLSIGTRARESLSLEQFAKKTGISKTQLYNYEKELCDSPPLKDLISFSNFLDIRLWELISYLEEGTGEIEDWSITMATPKDRYPWLRKYTYLQWLPTIVKAFCSLSSETRRNFVSKIKKQPELIDYISNVDKIDKRLIRSWEVATKEIEVG